MNRRLARRLIEGGAVCLAALALFCVYGHRYLLWNASASVPLGLYRRVADTQAPLIWFCLEGEALTEAKRHGLTMPGVCPNSSIPLLKPVYRGPQPLRFSPDGIWAEGHLLLHTKPKLRDLAGRPYKHTLQGVYHTRPDEVWAISTHHPDSYDSRYFGPINKRQILSYAQPFFTF